MYILTYTIESKLNGSVFEFGEEVIATSNKLVVNEDHGDGFPVVFSTELFSFLGSFWGLCVCVFDWNVVFLEVIWDLVAVWAVVTAEDENLSHWIYVLMIYWNYNFWWSLQIFILVLNKSVLQSLQFYKNCSNLWIQ